MNPSVTDRSPAKIRFFAIYIVSVLLIVLVLSSFLQPGTSNPSPDPVSNDRAATIELLYQRLAPLQAAAVTAMEKGASPEAVRTMERHKVSFLAVVDSLRKTTSDLKDDNEKAAINDLLNNFEQTAEKEQQLVRSFLSSPRNAVTAPARVDDAERQALKAMLLQKDKQIAELEQNKQPAEPTNSDNGEDEWKEKYNALKSANDKAASQLEAIKVSYREVVEDNRRLIAQLQAARSGKN